MELIEKKYAKEGGKLPRNVRQIGEPGGEVKVLIEDYAYTYLHQMTTSNLTCIRTAVLVGRTEEGPTVCIRGAFELDMGQEPRGWFTHEHWRQAFGTIRDWFEGLEVVGWCMANPGFPPKLTDELRTIHARNFSGGTQVFLQTDVLEGEEVFYACGENGLAPLPGYYIFYEKNDVMQAYMSDKKGGTGIEPEGIVRDKAATRFRSMMQEKKEQNVQKKTLAFLYGSCTFLVMVILVIGITLVNNYDRMTNMESAIHQISESLDKPEEPLEEQVETENRQALAETGLPTEDKESQESDEEPVPVPEEPENSEESGDANNTDDTEETQDAASGTVREPEYYQVQPGDTLLEISRAYYGNEDMVDKICEINGLADGDIIYIGETIVLP